MATTVTATPAVEPVKSSVRRVAPHWWLVAVLTAVSTLAYIDKNIVALMIVPIRAELGLTPTQAAFALGSAFAVANLCVTIPAGWLADRGDRRMIIMLAMSAWSILTVTSAFSQGFFTLLLARAGVGLAEGLLPPACYSLIRQSVALDHRGRALSIFSMSALVGSGLAFLLGGFALAFLEGVDISALPLIGHLPTWGVTLFATGMLGIPVALLILSLTEPHRAAPHASAVRFERMMTVVCPSAYRK